jgi:DNA helicase-2/ATP-dependent DNA helicase PcrA
MEEFMSGAILPAYLKRLNTPQREAAVTIEGPLIVLAGAGSGKTSMLTSRIAHLISHHRVPPYQILAMTFTNKAAAEMRSRVDRILSEVDSPLLGTPEIGTFHSVCIRMLRRELHHTPFRKQFVIYDDSDQLSLIKDVLAKLDIDPKAFSPKSFQAAINRLKCDAMEPEQVDPAPHSPFEKKLKIVYEQYQKDLFTNQALDFGEILCLTYRVLRDHPETRARYQELYRFIHVDEYQDTNRVQYLLLQQLVNPQTKNICVVGDEDQSIYKWRGADIRNILDFEQDYPGARVVKLEQNYRSSQNIISAASHVISHNTERKDKRLWTENEEGEKVQIIETPDDRAEAEFVVGEIKRLARDEALSLSEFVVFYRTHAQSRQLEDVLRREKYPYQVVGGVRFYDRKEIKDLLSYFRVILSPEDSVSVKRIINTPARGIGKSTLDKIDEVWLRSPSGTTFWQTLLESVRSEGMFSKGTQKKLESFVLLIEKLRTLPEQMLLSEIYHRILDETGYVVELRQENTPESLARIENLEEFNNVIVEFEEERLKGASAPERSKLLDLFLEQISLSSEIDETLDQATVRLMTLHSSKGLEFPVVFMVGMEEGLFPSTRGWEEPEPEEIEEERRLCYVGMTRAERKLYLLHAQMRRIWGEIKYNEPARFFDEMPERYTQKRKFGAPRSSFQSGLDPIESRIPSSPTLTSSWVGKGLDHPEYGRGKVVASEGSGNDQKVTIEFVRDHSRRKFFLRYVAPFFG